MSELILDKVTLSKRLATLVNKCSVSLAAGELVVVLGANGAGKTSLLQMAMGIKQPTAGSVMLDGVPLDQWSWAARARRLSYLPQIRPLAWPNRVRDIVALGRFAHGANVARLGTKDRHAVDQALADCHLQALALRKADTLSGGELARVHCARALASCTPLLLADEPTAALDPQHQHHIMSLLRRYVDAGAGALVVLHDVALAAQYADRLVWMHSGRITADGSVQDTLTSDQIKHTYAVAARVTPTDPSVEHPLDVYIDGPTE